MNSHLNYLMAKERTADLMRSAEQGPLTRAARTVEPNEARLRLSVHLFARLRTWVAGLQPACGPPMVAVTIGSGPMANHVRGADAEPSGRPDRGASRRRGEPTLTTAALSLQRAAGNRAVGALVQALARSPHGSTAKQAKPAGIACTVEDDGTIRAADGSTVIGFRDVQGTAFVTPDGKSPGPDIGTLLTPDGKKTTLVALHEVTLAAASGATTFSPKKHGHTVGVIGGGPHLDEVVMRSGTPVDPGAMPKSVAPSVTVGARISLQGDGTSIWRLVNFPSRDRSTITPTWVQSNHDRQEFAVRRDEIEKEVKNLPADLAKTVEDDVDVMAMVSIIEGPWSGKSPSWDVEASLGVFQWGAEKKTKATTSSSLGGFYKTLEDRSTAASKTAAKDRSPTDQFYVDTWKQVTDAGLSIAGGTLQIGGKDATGGEVETALEGPMGTGKLRAYQLVAAKDWLDDLRAKTVRPMTYGAKLLHAGFSAAGPTIKDGDRSVRIDAPAWAATVGAVCTSKKALALMANLLVNRPAWVNTVVWRALAPDDVSTQASGLVTKLTAAQDAAEQAAASAAATASPPSTRGKKKPEAKAKAKAKATITEANAADAQAYKALQELVFPRASRAPAQNALYERLMTIALEMYRIENTKPTAEERARRLVTTDVID